MRLQIRIPSEPQQEFKRQLGHCYRFSFELCDSEALYSNALLQTSSQSLKGKLLTNLVELQCLTEYSKAVELFEESIKVNTEVGNRIEIGKNHIAVAIAFCGLKKISKARYHFEIGNTIFKEVGYTSGVLFSLIAQFFIEINENNMQSAKVTFRKIDNCVHSLGIYGFLKILPLATLGSRKRLTKEIKKYTWKHDYHIVIEKSTQIAKGLVHDGQQNKFFISNLLSNWKKTLFTR